MGLYEFEGKRPSIGEGAFVRPEAVIIGGVTIGDGCYIGAGAVLRGACQRPDPWWDDGRRCAGQGRGRRVEVAGGGLGVGLKLYQALPARCEEGLRRL